MGAARIPLALVCCALLASCTAPGSQPTDPKAVLQAAGRQLAGLKTVTADVKFGPGVVFDNFALASATTRIRLPSDSDTNLKVKQQDFLIDVRLVAVGGRTYLKLPFGQFAELTPEQAAALPDLSRLFDAQHGLPPVLAQGKSPSLDGSESAGGHDSDRVKAGYTADQLGTALGAKPAGDVAAEFWVAKDDHLIRRVHLEGQLLQPGKDTSVDITLRDFNAPVDITKPV